MLLSVRRLGGALREVLQPRLLLGELAIPALGGLAVPAFGLRQSAGVLRGRDGTFCMGTPPGRSVEPEGVVGVWNAAGNPLVIRMPIICGAMNETASDKKKPRSLDRSMGFGVKCRGSIVSLVHRRCRR